MRALVDLVDRRRDSVTFVKTFNHDIFPWLCTALFGAIASQAIVWLIVMATGIDTEASRATATAAFSGLPLLATWFVASMMLVRTTDWRLWVIYILGIAIFVLLHAGITAALAKESALLTFIVIGITLLAAGRLFEYVKIRHIAKLQAFHVSYLSLGVYAFIAIGGAVAVCADLGKLY